MIEKEMAVKCWEMSHRGAPGIEAKGDGRPHRRYAEVSGNKALILIPYNVI
jgi:hypothetical protein